MNRLDAERRFEEAQLAKIRSAQILTPGEDVKICLSLWKHPQWLFLLGLWGRLFQRRYLLLLTQRRAILVHVPCYLVSLGWRYSFSECGLPCEFTLQQRPKESHAMGNWLTMPTALAALIGRRGAHALSGLKAVEVVRLAGAISTAPAPARSEIGHEA